jgi:hypothetical protein
MNECGAVPCILCTQVFYWHIPSAAISDIHPGPAAQARLILEVRSCALPTELLDLPLQIYLTYLVYFRLFNHVVCVNNTSLTYLCYFKESVDIIFINITIGAMLISTLI